MTQPAKSRLSEFLSALGLLSRLPVRPREIHPMHQAAWSFPLVGLVIGTLAALLASIALWGGLPPQIAALLALGSMILMTGALHQDGLADTADGLWGGWTQERRLEIMRDSRIGTYGVLSLILCLVLQGCALSTHFERGTGVAALITAAVASRAAMVPIMSMLPPARRDGLGHASGRPSGPMTTFALGLALLIAIALTGAGFVAVALGAALPVLWLAQTAHARIGGFTGDTLGAAQQLAETSALICLLCL